VLVYLLSDRVGNQFRLSYESSSNIRISRQVIISRITHIDEEARLQCNQLGSMMTLPPGCQVDYPPYRALYGEGYKSILDSELKEEANHSQLTIIRAKAFNRDHKITYAASLLEAADIFRKGGKVELLAEHNCHRHLIEVYPLRIQGKAKLYSSKDRLEVSLNYLLRDQMMEMVGDLEYIYEVCLQVKDNSLNSRKEMLNIFIYSWDG
jgi:hypothetical protein